MAMAPRSSPRPTERHNRRVEQPAATARGGLRGGRRRPLVVGVGVGGRRRVFVGGGAAVEGQAVVVAVVVVVRGGGPSSWLWVGTGPSALPWCAGAGSSAWLWLWRGPALLSCCGREPVHPRAVRGSWGWGRVVDGAVDGSRIRRVGASAERPPRSRRPRCLACAPARVELSAVLDSVRDAIATAASELPELSDPVAGSRALPVRRLSNGSVFLFSRRPGEETVPGSPSGR